ncbi:MAG: ATP cone domain-containing protein [Victivallales bacterium]
MIQLSSSAVIVVCEDGTRRSFEFDELQSRLYKSCLSCGINDSTLAEDITLSVEYVLKKISSGEQVFAVSEINSFVVRMLEDAGYPEIARNFIRQNKIQKIDVKPDLSLVSGIVRKHLAVEGDELESIVRKVLSSCDMLKIDKGSSSLIIELARYYREKDFEFKTSEFNMPLIKSGSPWCVTADQIIFSLSLDARVLASANILSVKNVSRLFPAVKIDLSLFEAARFYTLDKPLTELALLPCFRACATGITEISDVSEKLYGAFLAENGFSGHETSLPVFLRICDAAAFSDAYLDVKWPESGKCLSDMLALLASMVDREISIRSPN